MKDISHIEHGFLKIPSDDYPRFPMAKIQNAGWSSNSGQSAEENKLDRSLR